MVSYLTILFVVNVMSYHCILLLRICQLFSHHEPLITVYVSAVTNGLKQLEVPYILTGGSLLGAIRQHSILFCDEISTSPSLNQKEEISCMNELNLNSLHYLELIINIVPNHGRVEIKCV